MCECDCVTMLAEGKARRVNRIMKHKGHKGAICDCMREVHHQLAELDCVKFVLFFFFFAQTLFVPSIYLSIHPSTSAVPSHSLSVFHHSISKPDPHVNSVPPPPQTQPIATCPYGIPKMQLSDPPFAERGTMQRG